MFDGNEGLWVARVLVVGVLAVTFLQSGLDKVLDWKGNRAYFTTYFATRMESSLLRHFPTLLLVLVLLLEVTTGLLCATGTLGVLLARDTSFAFAGACLAGVTMAVLFTGQRLAKDYSGAAGAVPYFLTTLAAILLLG